MNSFAVLFIPGSKISLSYTHKWDVNILTFKTCSREENVKGIIKLKCTNKKKKWIVWSLDLPIWIRNHANGFSLFLNFKLLYSCYIVDIGFMKLKY